MNKKDLTQIFAQSTQIPADNSSAAISVTCLPARQGFAGICAKLLVLFSILLITNQVHAEETYNLSLKTGENFISLPLMPQDTDIAAVLAPIITQVRDVWEFDLSDTNDPWKHYQPGMEGYSDLTRMNVGKGYWVNVRTNVTLPINGTPVPENYLLTFRHGWNVFGWPYQHSQEISAALSALNFGADYTQISTFNSVSKQQENFLNQTTGDNWTAFSPGKAYYIYMLDDKTIRIGISTPIDTTPPGGTITINAGSQYISLTTVTLTLSAIDAASGMGVGAQMQFSNDNSTWSTPENYATTKTWQLSSGDGEKTVYVRYKDVAGNWSQSYSDNIIFDATPPNIIITSPADGSVVEETQITLTGTIDNVPFSDNVTLAQEGENIITKTAQDAAGNTVSVSIKVNLYRGTLIGPAGGEVLSPDGKVRLTIPEGALTENTYIKLLNVNKDTLASQAPQNDTLLSVVECKPYGLIFQKPAAMTYTLYQAEVPGTSVELGFYDYIQDKIIPTGQISTVATDSYSIHFSIMHFSTYAALKGMISTGAPIGSYTKIPLPDMFTGSFGHSIPLAISPGRKGMQPSLALNYRSSNSNSWLGIGFNLNPGYIVRSTRLGPPSYDDIKDTFYFVTDAGTTELVHLIDNLYQAKIESSFAKFFKEPDDSWKIIGKDGSIIRLGQATNSKETSTSGTYSWYITKAIDTNKNYIEYTYIKDEGKCYLNRIDYTGNDTGLSPTNSVEFFLETREDIPSSYISTSKISTSKRLKEIQVKVDSELVWKYVLEYEYSADTNRSLLKSIIQQGADGKELPKQGMRYQSAK